MSTTPHPGASRSEPRLIGQSSVMRQLIIQLDALSRRACTVLLRGETGTGKELAARSIHARSPRAGGPFVPVDCTTLRDTLFESQLFGHVRGAFTGADRPTLGFFRSADGGTLFLDEIGELPLHIQAKLLRCIQEGEVVPLGSVAPVRVDVRILAATHRDLAAMVREGTFRADLFYRLNVAALAIPPLRDRKEDIASLAQYALRDLARFYHEPEKSLSTSAMHALHQYDWPGNVRELVNTIEHALVFAAGESIEFEDLPATIRDAEPIETNSDDVIITLEASERGLISRALRAANGNQTRAAQMLAIERHRLRRIIRRYHLEHFTRSQICWK